MRPPRCWPTCSASTSTPPPDGPSWLPATRRAASRSAKADDGHSTLACRMTKARHAVGRSPPRPRP
jgi:hypothetical protein